MDLWHIINQADGTDLGYGIFLLHYDTYLMRYPSRAIVEAYITNYTAALGTRIPRGHLYKRRLPTPNGLPPPTVEDVLAFPEKYRTYMQDLAMAMYMKKYALRSPMMPQGLQNTKTLYRGMVLRKDEVHKLLNTMRFEHAGFMSFTRDIGIAKEFGPPNVIFWLDTKDVPKGTPWVWFAPWLKEHIEQGPFRSREPGKMFVGSDMKLYVMNRHQYTTFTNRRRGKQHYYVHKKDGTLHKAEDGKQIQPPSSDIMLSHFKKEKEVILPPGQLVLKRLKAIDKSVIMRGIDCKFSDMQLHLQVSYVPYRDTRSLAVFKKTQQGMRLFPKQAPSKQNAPHLYPLHMIFNPNSNQPAYDNRGHPPTTPPLAFNFTTPARKNQRELHTRKRKQRPQ